MAAPTIRQIRSGMGTRLATISGLRVFDTVPGQFSPPAAIVGMPRRVRSETMVRGNDRYQLDVWVVVARQADAQSEKKLEKYLSPTETESIRAAVLGDTTFGGVINDIHEMSAEATTFAFGPPDQEVTYLGLEFTFELLAAGKD